MSSSRAIAAARQRRSGDVVQKPPMSQQQQRLMQQQPQRGPMQRMSAPAAVAPQSVYQVPPQQVRPKLEVGTAIGLITLRLGKLEQFIQQISENGEFKKDLVVAGEASLPDNSKVVDNSVFTSILNRLDALEKRTILMENEFRGIKQSLVSLNAGMERLSNEQSERFQDLEIAITDIEGKIGFDAPTTTTDLHFTMEELATNELGIKSNEDAEGISYEISE
jgi:hypothetical protein